MIWDSIIKGVGDLAGGAFKLIDDLHTSDEEKAELKLKMQALMTQHEKDMMTAYQEEVKSRSDIIKAEMSQEDKFTKRARPMTMYMFLLIIAMNYCVFPAVAHFTGMTMPTFILPPEAWSVFKIVFSVYAVGRTFEKTDAIGKLTKTFKRSEDAYK